MDCKTNKKRDLKVLEQLYDENPLNEIELSRAIYLVEMLHAEVKRRLKK